MDPAILVMGACALVLAVALMALARLNHHEPVFRPGVACDAYHYTAVLYQGWAMLDFDVYEDYWP